LFIKISPHGNLIVTLPAIGTRSQGNYQWFVLIEILVTTLLCKEVHGLNQLWHSFYLFIYFFLSAPH